MAYIVSAEEMDGQWIAHVPDLPGCFSTHKERDAAISGVPAAVDADIARTGRHGLRGSGVGGPRGGTEDIHSRM